jgi:hypothetical protein
MWAAPERDRMGEASLSIHHPSRGSSRQLEMIPMAKYLGPINFSRRVAHAASAMFFALTIGAAYETAAQTEFGAGRSQRNAGFLAESGRPDPGRGGFA